MLKGLKRITGLFTSLDRNGDGRISRREFVKAVPLMVFKQGGAPYDKEAIEATFADLDHDQSGDLEYNELRVSLRRGATIELDEKLQVGAMGVIEMDSRNLYALRTSSNGGKSGALSGKASGSSGVLQPKRRALNPPIPPIPLKVVETVGELRAALVRGSKRLGDLFRLFDRNGDGRISRHEFAIVLPFLGIDGSCKPLLDDIFDSIDLDGNGQLDYDELEISLGESHKLQLPSRKYAYPWELRKRNKAASRLQAGARRFRARLQVRALRGGAADVVNERVRRDNDQKAAAQLQRFWRRRKAQRRLLALATWAERTVASRRKRAKEEARKAKEEAERKRMEAEKRRLNKERLAEKKKKRQALEKEHARELRAAEAIERARTRQKVRRAWEPLLLWASREAKRLVEEKAAERARRAKFSLTSMEDLKAALASNAMNVVSLFRIMDRDGHGTITKREFAAALPLLGLNSDNRDAFDRIFDDLDADGRGTIDYAEFAKAMKQRDAAVKVQARHRGNKTRAQKQASKAKSNNKGSAKPLPKGPDRFSSAQRIVGEYR